MTKDVKEPMFSKCLVLTSNALLFQLGGLLLAAGIYLFNSEYKDLESETITNVSVFALVIGGAWVGISMLGCCTLEYHCTRFEYLFLLVVLLTTAATAYSVYVLRLISDDLNTENALTPGNDGDCLGDYTLTRAEMDLQESFNDLYVNFKNEDSKYSFFYDWYADNCVADIGSGVCPSCQETNMMDVDTGELTCPPDIEAYQGEVCSCCDAYLCCYETINNFVVDRLVYLEYGFYGLIAIQAVIIICTTHHIWNTVEKKNEPPMLQHREHDFRFTGANLEQPQSGSTTSATRQVLRRASQERCEKDTLIVAWEYGLRPSVEVELGFGVDVAVALGKS